MRRRSFLAALTGGPIAAWAGLRWQAPEIADEPIYPILDRTDDVIRGTGPVLKLDGKPVAVRSISVDMANTLSSELRGVGADDEIYQLVRGVNRPPELHLETDLAGIELTREMLLDNRDVQVEIANSSQVFQGTGKVRNVDSAVDARDPWVSGGAVEIYLFPDSLRVTSA